MTALSTYYGGFLNAGSLAYQDAFNASDLNGLSTTNNSVLSSLAAFDNTGGVSGTPDEFMDVSFVGAFAAAQTVAAGNAIGLAIAYLQGDGVTYGDGRLTAGTQTTGYQPVTDVVQGIGFPLGSSITILSGDTGLIALRPHKFKLIAVGNLPGSLASSGNMIYISTYKLRNDAAN